jgi:hypothetical protein
MVRFLEDGQKFNDRLLGVARHEIFESQSLLLLPNGLLTKALLLLARLPFTLRRIALILHLLTKRAQFIDFGAGHCIGLLRRWGERAIGARCTVRLGSLPSGHGVRCEMFLELLNARLGRFPSPLGGFRATRVLGVRGALFHLCKFRFTNLTVAHAGGEKQLNVPWTKVGGIYRWLGRSESCQCDSHPALNHG